jgi:hypothetical protein
MPGVKESIKGILIVILNLRPILIGILAYRPVGRLKAA